MREFIDLLLYISFKIFVDWHSAVYWFYFITAIKLQSFWDSKGISIGSNGIWIVRWLFYVCNVWYRSRRKRYSTSVRKLQTCTVFCYTKLWCLQLSAISNDNLLRSLATLRTHRFQLNGKNIVNINELINEF